MRPPGATRLLALALGLSAGSGAAALLLPLIGLRLSTEAVLIGGLGCYNLVLISWIQPAAGQAVGSLLTLALTILALIFSPFAGPALLILLGWTWLLRCALLHRSIFSCLADGALLAFGVAAALWANLSGAGLALSLWCFYLTQTLLPWLPGRRRGQSEACEARHGAVSAGEFSAARSRAEAALQRIYKRPLK